MRIEAYGVPCSALLEYSRISIAFEVHSVLDVHHDPESGHFTLTERQLEAPYLKDYDILGETPERWARHFNTSNWGLLTARVDDQCVGGAILARDTPGLPWLEDRSDLTVLCDLRIAPKRRRQGIGAALIAAAEGWAIERECRQIKVESQNINLPACRFYERQGFRLRFTHSGMYAACPEEIQLLWYKDLEQGENTGYIR